MGERRDFPLLFPEERPSLLRRLAGPLVERGPGKEHEEAPADPGPERASVAEPAAEAEVDRGPLQRLTLQLLPGRLQPIDPAVLRQEIRFLKAGPREATVVLGWAPGDPPHHITLDHPSIEPRHARMRFQEGRWSIESLHPRNLVEVNGRRLPVGEPPWSLEADDRVRLGSVAFRFIWP
jgi:hypothetical protein